MSNIYLLQIIVISSFLPTSSSKNPRDLTESTNSREVSALLENFAKDFQGCELVSVMDAGSNYTFSENVNFQKFHEFSAGVQQVQMGFNITFPRHEDIHRYSLEHCSFGILSFQEFTKERESWLVETIIPRYGPIMRKDQDHFLLLTPNEGVSDLVLTSPMFGSKIKYKLAVHLYVEGRAWKIICKNVDLYSDSGKGQLEILKEFDNNNNNFDDSSNLFPDMTKQFHGKVFRFAIPKVAFRFELEKRSDGKYHPKRGFYKWWLDEAMKKFNFTYEMFYASFGGGTGKLLKNGTWVGATGDLYYGKADCSFIVGEIYSRHKFLGWSSSISYEWVIFITHPPRNSYSAKAIFKPFTPLMWALFFASLTLMTFCLKNVAHAGFDPGSEDQKFWGYFRSSNYVIATFLEQDKEGSFTAHSVRTLCAFWLLFAMVTATAYRGKLVSLIAFPINTWVPETFEELANSHFKVALNVVGKAGAAYVLIATSTSPVFQTLASKMELVSEADVCLQRAMDEDLGCIIWKGIADYAMVKNLTDKHGHVPLQESSQIALFIGDGLVYERRAIFGQHLDRTIQAVVQMGLTIKWLQLDQEFIKKERKIYENSRKITQKVYDYDDGPKKLVVSQFVGLFLLSFAAILLSWALFTGEIIWHRRGKQPSLASGIENMITANDSNDSSTIPFQASEVRHELYEMGLLSTSHWTYNIEK